MENQADSTLLRLGLIGAVLAAILPVYLIAFGAPLSAGDPAAFAQIHATSAFFWRGLITLLYFPAAIVAHYVLVMSFSPRSRPLALLGFSFFLLGNAIDGCYRAVQFMLVHYNWGAQLLQEADPATRELLWQQVVGFSELAPAIQLSFAICFGVGRLLMGSAGLRGAGTALTVTCLLLILTGTLNVLPWIGRLAGIQGLTLPFAVYLWIWLAGLVAMAVTIIGQLRRRTVSATALAS